MKKKKRNFFRKFRLRVGDADIPDSQFRPLLLTIFFISGVIFLWAPTQWMWQTFRHYWVFDRAVLPSFPKGSWERLPGPWSFPKPSFLKRTGSVGGHPSPKKPRPVVFRLLAPAAQKVFLGGSFNNFEARRHPLKRRSDGLWEITMHLAPGRYQYKFKVDGRWILDPTNPEKMPAPRKSSILEIK